MITKLEMGLDDWATIFLAVRVHPPSLRFETLKSNSPSAVRFPSIPVLFCVGYLNSHIDVMKLLTIEFSWKSRPGKGYLDPRVQKHHSNSLRTSFQLTRGIDNLLTKSISFFISKKFSTPHVSPSSRFVSSSSIFASSRVIECAALSKHPASSPFATL